MHLYGIINARSPQMKDFEKVPHEELINSILQNDAKPAGEPYNRHYKNSLQKCQAVLKDPDDAFKLTFLSMTILYADDDAEDKEMFCDALRQINPRIKTILAPDGLQALRILKSCTELPSHIFLDINMPIMTGTECLIKIKTIERLSRIPVIMLSTTSNKPEIKNVIQLGAQYFMNKTYSFNNLVQNLTIVLSKRYFARL
jgi:CheY-like chemotaxis protein